MNKLLIAMSTIYLVFVAACFSVWLVSQTEQIRQAAERDALVNSIQHPEEPIPVRLNGLTCGPGNGSMLQKPCDPIFQRCGVAR